MSHHYQGCILRANIMEPQPPPPPRAMRQRICVFKAVIWPNTQDKYGTLLRYNREFVFYVINADKMRSLRTDYSGIGRILFFVVTNLDNLKYWDRKTLAKRVHPDQTLQNFASDQDLYVLLLIQQSLVNQMHSADTYQLPGSFWSDSTILTKVHDIDTV